MTPLRLLFVSLLLLPFQVTGWVGEDGVWAIGPKPAFAGDDEDDDEDDEDEDDEEDDDEDDDDEDDDEDDEEGSEDSDDRDDDEDDADSDEDLGDRGDDDDDDEEAGGVESGTESGSQSAPAAGSAASSQSSPSRRTGTPENLHLRYPNGWDEMILDGRYILIDPEGRTVSDRLATFDDLDRMRQLAGL